jgi:hypothetical protein
MVEHEIMRFIFVVFLVHFQIGLAQLEARTLSVESYLDVAYDPGKTIAGLNPPSVSKGVIVIARSQDLSKKGDSSDVTKAIEIMKDQIESSGDSWERDLLTVNLALAHATIGDFKIACDWAEKSLGSVNFKRLQELQDEPLIWIRNRFGGDSFSQSVKDYMLRLAGAYYLDYAEPNDFDKAEKYFLQLSDHKARDQFIIQIESRRHDQRIDSAVKVVSPPPRQIGKRDPVVMRWDMVFVIAVVTIGSSVGVFILLKRKIANGSQR